MPWLPDGRTPPGWIAVCDTCGNYTAASLTAAADIRTVGGTLVSPRRDPGRHFVVRRVACYRCTGASAAASVGYAVHWVRPDGVPAGRRIAVQPPVGLRPPHRQRPRLLSTSLSDPESASGPDSATLRQRRLRLRDRSRSPPGPGARGSREAPSGPSTAAVPGPAAPPGAASVLSARVDELAVETSNELRFLRERVSLLEETSVQLVRIVAALGTARGPP